MVNGVEGFGGYYLSAYGIAVKHGFHGTEEDWLEYLRAGEMQLKLEQNALFWKTDKDSDWQELSGYREVFEQLDEIKETAQDAVTQAQDAAVKAEQGAADCQKECSEKCTTMVTESEQKVTAAVAEIEKLSAERDEIKELNEQAKETADKVNHLVTVSRVALVSGTDELESGCLYIVY